MPPRSVQPVMPTRRKMPKPTASVTGTCRRPVTISVRPLARRLRRLTSSPITKRSRVRPRIDPWTKYLRALGVQLHLGQTCTGLDVAGGRIDGARFASGLVARGDHYVLSVP